jgi:hypothetical protein
MHYFIIRGKQSTFIASINIQVNKIMQSIIAKVFYVLHCRYYYLIFAIRLSLNQTEFGEVCRI